MLIIYVNENMYMYDVKIIKLCMHWNERNMLEHKAYTQKCDCVSARKVHRSKCDYVLAHKVCELKCEQKVNVLFFMFWKGMLYENDCEQVACK